MRINDVEVGWSMISITSTVDLGIGEDSKILSGVTGISWNRKRIKEKKYGLGADPYANGFGNNEYEASITFRTSVQQALRGQLNTMLELGMFDLTIVFNSEFETQDIPLGSNTIILKNCMITEDGSEFKQGDTDSEKTFELDPMKIIFQSGDN